MRIRPSHDQITHENEPILAGHETDQLQQLLGIVRGVLKKQASTWQRTDRLAEPPRPTT